MRCRLTGAFPAGFRFGIPLHDESLFGTVFAHGRKAVFLTYPSQRVSPHRRTPGTVCRSLQKTVKHNGEFSNAAPDFLHAHCGKAEIQSLVRIRALGIAAQGSHLDIPPGCRSGGYLAVKSAAEPDLRLQSGLNTCDLQQPGRGPLRTLPQNRQTLRAQLPHAPSLPPKMALRNEIAKHRLLTRRCAPAGIRDGRGDFVRQVRRDHQVAQTQRWKQHLAETTGKQHQSAVIKSLQCGRWAPRVPKLAVIVGSTTAAPDFAARSSNRGRRAKLIVIPNGK